MIQEFQQQILRLEREVNELVAENKRLRDALEPFSEAGHTMSVKFGNSVADTDIIELYFAKNNKYIYPIYAFQLQNATKFD